MTTHPLIDQLVTEHGYPVLDAGNIDSFIEATPWTVLFFTEDPARFQESLDVAVILPELVKQFPQLTPAIVARKDDHLLQARYSFTAWPTLVFLAQGKYLGAISKVQNWDDYLRDIERILAATPRRNPGIGIPVVSASSTSSCRH